MTLDKSQHKPMRQCEICNCSFRDKDSECGEHPVEIIGSRHREAPASTFLCSDQCWSEYEDNRRIYHLEAKQQWDLYGDDVDSWFR